MLPVVPAPIRDDALPARRWHATTFISRELGADLPGLSGEDLSALTMIPGQVVAAWAARAPAPVVDPHPALRDALQRIPPGSPAVTFVSAASAGRDELRVTLPGGALVLVRAERGEGHGTRLCATVWLPDHRAKLEP